MKKESIIRKIKQDIIKKKEWNGFSMLSDSYEYLTSKKYSYKSSIQEPCIFKAIQSK